jgi:hypothetical protein
MLVTMKKMIKMMMMLTLNKKIKLRKFRALRKTLQKMIKPRKGRVMMKMQMTMVKNFSVNWLSWPLLKMTQYLKKCIELRLMNMA